MFEEVVALFRALLNARIVLDEGRKQGHWEATTCRLQVAFQVASRPWQSRPSRTA